MRSTKGPNKKFNVKCQVWATIQKNPAEKEVQYKFSLKKILQISMYNDFLNIKRATESSLRINWKSSNSRPKWREKPQTESIKRRFQPASQCSLLLIKRWFFVLFSKVRCDRIRIGWKLRDQKRLQIVVLIRVGWMNWVLICFMTQLTLKMMN